MVVSWALSLMAGETKFLTRGKRGFCSIAPMFIFVPLLCRASNGHHVFVDGRVTQLYLCCVVSCNVYVIGQVNDCKDIVTPFG
jgi:hypothetical protein